MRQIKAATRKLAHHVGMRSTPPTLACNSALAPRLDLLVANVTTRALLADVMEKQGFRVIEHLPGIEVDFPGPRNVETALVVIAHDPRLLDALVATARLRAIGIRAPILIMAPNADATFLTLAALHGADVATGAEFSGDRIAARARRLIGRL